MAAVAFQQNFSRRELTRGAPRPGNRNERWAVILAGGDGTRLRSMTRAISGDDRPKQFCPVVGGRTLLDQTRDRVALSVRPDKTLLVVTEKHRRFYHPLAAALSPELIVEQPESKGTAPAILYALQRVAHKAPHAVVALFPSDHYFADDEAFMAHVDAAYAAVHARPETVTLLGITPAGAELDYGWIEPQKSIFSAAPGSITRVQRFWEKPSAQVAQNLLGRGCLWNSFVMVGRVDALLQLTKRALSEMHALFAGVAHTFGTNAEPGAIRALYSRIAETNFSHQVLATCPEGLAVMRVGDVGWSDLGEPTRVLSILAQSGVLKFQVPSSKFQVSGSVC